MTIEPDHRTDEQWLHFQKQAGSGRVTIVKTYQSRKSLVENGKKLGIRVGYLTAHSDTIAAACYDKRVYEQMWAIGYDFICKDTGRCL